MADRSAEQSRGVEGTVVELLPQAACRVQLGDRSLVIAHAAAASEVNFVRLRPQDRVWVELSPHDPTRGRIVRLLAEGSR
ncbi:MAG: translation initiation factor IF-1 [Bryobacteraceae bacterium]|nr:translation initiation factor IF-1 [Bryobacteraceae bacterium]